MVNTFNWWLLFCLAAMLLVVFFSVGIYLLSISFRLQDPMIMVALFFSASFLILVSLSLFAGLIVKGMDRLRKGKKKLFVH